MLVMKIDKELSTEECIKYGKELSEFIGEKVIILDSKVKEFYRLDKEKVFVKRKPLTFETINYDDTSYSKKQDVWKWF